MPDEGSKYKEQLLELAGGLLNERGQEAVRDYLDADDFRSARIYLLGALDRGAMEFGISTTEVKAKYELLGFDPEESCRLRQNAAK